jgi:predicted amidohydrolase
MESTGFLGVQHKVHVCGNDRIYELGQAWEMIEVDSWHFGTTICFDAEFPEAARILALKGAEVVLVPFASGRRNAFGQAAEPQDWAREIRVWAPSRAYDNRIFVLGVNHGANVTDARGDVVNNPRMAPGVEEWALPGSVHGWPGYSFVVAPC